MIFLGLKGREGFCVNLFIYIGEGEGRGRGTPMILLGLSTQRGIIPFNGDGAGREEGGGECGRATGGRGKDRVVFN